MEIINCDSKTNVVYLFDTGVGHRLATLRRGELSGESPGRTFFLSKSLITKLAIMKTDLESASSIFRLLEDSGTGHLILGPELEIVWTNAAFIRFMGVEKTQLVGKNVMDVVTAIGPDLLFNYSVVQSDLSEAYSGGRPIAGLQAHLKPGEGRQERWLELWSHPIAEGEYAGGRIEYFYDITANKKNEYRLGLLTGAVEQSTEGITLIGLDGKLLFANDAFAKMHGYSIQDTLGCHIHQFRRKEDTRDFQDEIRMVEQAGTFTGEALHLKKSGDYFPVKVTVSVVRGEEGKSKGFLCTVGDISEQTNYEKEMLESRRTLDTLMSNLPGMAYRCQNNPEWTMEFVSAGCLPLTGYDDSDLLYNKSLSYNDLIHVDDRQTVWEQVQDALNSISPFTLNYKIRTKDGQVKWVWEQGRGVYDENGNLVALEGFVTDVTENKRIEEALRESEGKFRRLAETTNALIFIYQDQKLIYANPAAARITGYSYEDIDKMDFWDIIHPEQREEVRRRGFARLSGADVPSRYEVKVLTKTGDTVWLDFTGTRLDYAGVPAILGTAFEITERKLAENRLRAATRELRRERQELSEKNVALKQILEHLENERQEYKQEISQEIEQAVSPYLGRLKTTLGSDNKELKALEENLHAIIRKDIDLFKERYVRLTPRELEICDFIRKGMSSKQISQELNLSVATVQKHREQIRKKLAITNKSINLGSYLRSH